MASIDTSKMAKDILSWGLRKEIPNSVEAAWGARWIFPDDVVHDRTSWFNGMSEAGDRLAHWLDGGALMRSRESARSMARSDKITPTSQETVVLHEDEVGKIVGNPNRSHGYLYVAAWLKEANGD